MVNLKAQLIPSLRDEKEKSLVTINLYVYQVQLLLNMIEDVEKASDRAAEDNNIVGDQLFHLRDNLRGMRYVLSGAITEESF